MRKRPGKPGRFYFGNELSTNDDLILRSHAPLARRLEGCAARPHSFETHRFAMLLRMRAIPQSSPCTFGIACVGRIGGAAGLVWATVGCPRERGGCGAGALRRNAG